MSGYRELNIYKKSFELAIAIHKMSLTLPKHELYEQGSQIRRSSKSVKSNIVEGYGRKRYPKDYVKFLVYAQSSCDETIDHLETIKTIYDKIEVLEMIEEYNTLGKMIFRFIQAIEVRN